MASDYMWSWLEEYQGAALRSYLAQRAAQQNDEDEEDKS